MEFTQPVISPTLSIISCRSYARHCHADTYVTIHYSALNIHGTFVDGCVRTHNEWRFCLYANCEPPCTDLADLTWLTVSWNVIEAHTLYTHTIGMHNFWPSTVIGNRSTGSKRQSAQFTGWAESFSHWVNVVISILWQCETSTKP